MKRTAIALSILFAAASCKKEGDIAKSGAAPTLTAVAATQTVTPGSRKALGTVKIKAGNLDGLSYYIQGTIGGTVPLSQIRNVYYVAKKGQTDSIVSQKTSLASDIRFDWADFEKNTEYTVTVYGDISAGATGQITLTLTVQYWWKGSRDNYGDSAGSVTCAPVTVSLYTTTPKLEWIELSGIMRDSVPMTAYKFTIANSGPDRLSFQQFAFTVNINDVGNDDNMSAYNVQLIVNGVDVTDSVKFSSATAVSITTIPEGSNKMYASFWKGARELRILPGDAATIELRFTPSGLAHDGNGISVQLLSDAVQTSPGYINVLSSSSSVVKITSLQPYGSAGTVYNLTWSIDGPSHSAIPGSSSMTFLNGYGIPALGIQNFHQ